MGQGTQSSCLLEGDKNGFLGPQAGGSPQGWLFGQDVGRPSFLQELREPWLISST